MGRTLGQTITVENKSGAGGTAGTSVVAKAKPDGYTLLLTNTGFTAAPSLYHNALSYDIEKDFEPIGLIVNAPMTIIANNDLPVSNFKEFRAYLMANKATVNLAHAGMGSASHLCSMLLMKAFKTNVQTIPYNGTGPAMAALRAHQVDFMCDQTTNTTGEINNNTVKALAVTSSKRLNILPNVPTVKELKEPGLKDFKLNVWHGLWVPKGTPKAVQVKLVAALQQSLNNMVFKGYMTQFGTVIYGANDVTPAALRKTVKSELNYWTAIVAKSGAYTD
jgi:tripartite-type tricarboxylate transporter receptor subunit TctC